MTQRGSRQTRAYPDAHNDTQQAHLLIQEKATSPVGIVPEVRIGRSSGNNDRVRKPR